MSRIKVNRIEVGKRIKKTRDAKRMSLMDVSILTNVNKSTLHSYEKGRAAPNKKTAAMLAIVLNTTVDYLYYGDNLIKCSVCGCNNDLNICLTCSNRLFIRLVTLYSKLENIAFLSEPSNKQTIQAMLLDEILYLSSQKSKSEGMKN